jgi:hypothetical protein
MGGSRLFCSFLQGGGVTVFGGTVAISSCTISGNSAGEVRAHAQKFPSPPWETHVHSFVCREAVSWSGVAHWPSHRAPSVGIQLIMCAHMFKSSIAPMGEILTCLPRLTLAQLRTLRSTTGGACRRDLDNFHRPQGALPTCPNRLSSFNSDRFLFYQGYVRATATPANFPSPRWESC